MPVKLTIPGPAQRAAEPWSAVARDDLEEGKAAVAALARSVAHSRLADEIRSYVRGRSSGRAFLIAGHRGAGKTTAVLSALQTVYNQCASPDSEPDLVCCRPLLVRLHAPSLIRYVEEEDEELPDGKKGKNEEQKETKTSDNKHAAKDGGHAKREDRAEDDADPLRKQTLCFLREMAAGIFPALLDELNRCLRFFKAEPELSAHLRDEMTRGMPIGEVRELMRRLGRIDATQSPGLIPFQRCSLFDQLVAINAASEAYLIVTGKLEAKADATLSLAETIEQRLRFEYKSESLIRPLALAGATLAAAVGFNSGHPLPALGAALAVLASGFGYSSNASNKLARAAAYTRSFSQDNTQNALLRRIPLLVEQLRQAGFPVIFVLDELDKLNDPAKFLHWLMTNLKSYVTERSFICFVVERGYYQHLVQSSNARKKAYQATHTFFSRLAYVVISPREFHAYLSRRLGSALRLDTEAKLVRATFRHFVLHCARLHAYDAEQTLDQVLATGELARAELLGAPPNVWICHAWLQICIEWVISAPKFVELVEEDSYAMQLGYDVLYAVTSRWQAMETVPLESDDLADLEPQDRAALSPKALGLLKEAREQLIQLLTNSSTLLESLAIEKEAARVGRFLFEGFEDPRGARALEVSDKLRKHATVELDESTLKYFLIVDLIRRLTIESVSEKGMLNAKGDWTHDEHGRPRNAAPNEVKDALARLDRLMEAYAKDARDELTFQLLFDLALAPRRFGSFAKDLAGYRAAPDAPGAAVPLASLESDVRLLEEFASSWSTAYEAFGEFEGPSLNDRMKLLRYALEGSTPRQRLESLGKFGSALRTERAELATAPDKVKQRWLESVVERTLATLQNRAPAVEATNGARVLDALAWLMTWFPVGLSERFDLDLKADALDAPRWFRANAWSISQASELAATEFSELPTAGAFELRWLAALACRLLHHKLRAEQLLVGTQPDGSIARTSLAAGAWLSTELERERPIGRRVLVMNPGVLLGAWRVMPDLPVPIVAVSVVLDDVASDSPADATQGGPDNMSKLLEGWDLILVEDEELRDRVSKVPRMTAVAGDRRLVVFVQQAPTGTPPRFDEEAGVVLVSGPQGLRAAVELTLRTQGQ